MIPDPTGPVHTTLALRNAMTVDVEDYFQVQAFAKAIDRNNWDRISCRVEGNIARILDQFARAGVRATFFTLGWIAERYPAMVRRIVAAGHELASHGYDHIPADQLGRDMFRADVGRTRRLLEDIGATSVIGYRAPTFSIGPRNPWAFEALESEGYTYSSSVFPIRHDFYGVPDAPRFAYHPGEGDMWEIPMTTIRIAGRNLPCSGGGYFRLLPYQVYRLGLSRLNRVEKQAGVFYFHPWEIDTEQPRVSGCGWKSHLRHHVNIARMPRRLERLLHDFAWDRMDEVFADVIGRARVP